MKKILPAGLMLLTTGVMITTVVLAQSYSSVASNAVSDSLLPQSADGKGAPPRTSPPTSVDALVYAQRFVLQQGYRSYWSREKTFIRSGFLVVLKVDPALVYPHEAATPMLYVGDQTAERINVGYLDGHVIAIVPGSVDIDTAPIWFGTPDLPERVDAQKIAAERQLADAAGIRTIAADERTAAFSQGGAVLYAYDKVELLQSAAALIEEYAPSEQDLADMFTAMRNP